VTTTLLKSPEPVPEEVLAEMAETEIQLDKALAELPNFADIEYPFKPYETPFTRRMEEPVEGIFWGPIAPTMMLVNEKVLVLKEPCLEQDSASKTEEEADAPSFA
jgi:hypothetical protein